MGFWDRRFGGLDKFVGDLPEDQASRGKGTELRQSPTGPTNLVVLAQKVRGHLLRRGRVAVVFGVHDAAAIRSENADAPSIHTQYGLHRDAPGMEHI